MMTINIDDEQAEFIRMHAEARIKTAMHVLEPHYERQFLSHMPEVHIEQNRQDRRNEIAMLQKLILTIKEAK